MKVMMTQDERARWRQDAVSSLNDEAPFREHLTKRDSLILSLLDDLEELERRLAASKAAWTQLDEWVEAQDWDATSERYHALRDMIDASKRAREEST